MLELIRLFWHFVMLTLPLQLGLAAVFITYIEERGSKENDEV